MISAEQAKQLFRAHAAVTKCEWCMAFAKEEGYLATCPCGWDLAQAVLASANPDIDVLVMEVVDVLDELGWTFTDRIIKPTGRMITGRPHMGLADKFVQLNIGSCGDAVFAILVNGAGWMRGFLIPERTIDAVKHLIEQTAETMPSLTTHEIPDAVVDLVKRITA